VIVSESDVQRAAAAYDAMADAYAADVEDNAYNALYERPALIALLPAVAGRRVLEAGCGSGPLTAWLVDNGAEVVAFDASPRQLKLARRRGLRSASFVAADLSAPLDFLDDDAFDIVVAGLVLHYCKDWVAPLREIRRVLKPGGVVALSTHHPAWDIALSPSPNYFATELVRDTWSKGGRDYEVTFWRRPLSAMFRAIAQAGFRVDRLAEPQPRPECRVRFPEAWEQLTTRPTFLFFRLTPL